MDSLFIYLVTGAGAGILAGLLGVGGGLIIVPALAFYFAYSHIAAEYLMHLAIGTSLATIVVTGLASAIAHHRHGAVDWAIVVRLAPWLVIGAGSGALLANYLATSSLRVLFGIFELAVAAQLAFDIKPDLHRTLPGKPGFGVAGWVIGTVSSLMGIGGGTLTVPFLTWNSVSMHRAVATSAACGVPIALAGMSGFVVAGWEVPGLPSASTGFIYWPACAGISAASVLCAPVGAHLAHRVPGRRLRHIFAGFLAIVAIKMLSG